MLKKLYGGPVLFILLLWIVLSLSRCATTGSTMQQNETQVEDVADIDELLGLAEEETSKPQKRDDSVEEDDVLRLLGVVEQGETTSPGKTGNTTQSNLKQEIQRLESEQSQLDQQEKGLQKTVAQQTQTLAAAKSGSEVTKPKANWNTLSYTDQYQNALKEYRARRYLNAIQKFEDMLSKNNKHSLSDNCQYWIGESYYGLAKYQQAIMAFEKVFAFTNTNKNDDAQLKLGLCYIKMDDKERAKVSFQKLIDNYPTSEFVSLAKRFISQMEEE